MGIRNLLFFPCIGFTRVPDFNVNTHSVKFRFLAGSCRGGGAIFSFPGPNFD